MVLIKSSKTGVSLSLPHFQQNLLCSIVQLMPIIDINKYLPNETILWISQQLETIDIDLSTLQGSDLLADGSRLHFRVYYQLQELV
jgi:hypothetical protein